MPSSLYKSKQGHIRAGSVKMTAQILSVPASMSHTFCHCARKFILGHPRGLSENDSKSCCYFKKAREDVPAQGFTALWGGTNIFSHCGGTNIFTQKGGGWTKILD